MMIIPACSSNTALSNDSKSNTAVNQATDLTTSPITVSVQESSVSSLSKEPNHTETKNYVPPVPISEAGVTSGNSNSGEAGKVSSSESPIHESIQHEQVKIEG